MTETISFALLLLTISVALVVSHLRLWRQRDHGGLTDEDYAFFRGQYFRRLITSGLIGVIGLVMLGHLWVRDLRFVSFLWLAVLTLVGGVLVLALFDWAASRRFVRRHMAEHAKLRQQMVEEAKEMREQRRRESK